MGGQPGPGKNYIEVLFPLPKQPAFSSFQSWQGTNDLKGTRGLNVLDVNEEDMTEIWADPIMFVTKLGKGVGTWFQMREGKAELSRD